MDQTNFLWMFPCYVLASNFTRTPDGEPVFDENISFATPKIAPGQKPAIAIFTDSAAAYEFIELTYPNAKIDLIEIPNTAKLKDFLDVVSPYYNYLAVDLNPKTRLPRPMLIEDVLANLHL